MARLCHQDMETGGEVVAVMEAAMKKNQPYQYSYFLTSLTSKKKNIVEWVYRDF